ncbi:hypothetical protein BDW02DRAFT_267292 [Decorospora gaudefroyi]|uniref:Secreted protein n=1 Tax=Decorospora gaudefroyi TaxID=184978 RepID=A0A6A5KJM5_9PLEO|nr:hypothetical protein BDW02DRAFT_267292 [Decorospora gaudefroyi]
MVSSFLWWLRAFVCCASCIPSARVYISEIWAAKQGLSKAKPPYRMLSIDSQFFFFIEERVASQQKEEQTFTNKSYRRPKKNNTGICDLEHKTYNIVSTRPL